METFQIPPKMIKADAGPITDSGMLDATNEGDLSGNREFDIDGCWAAELLLAEQNEAIDFSGFRRNNCSMEEEETGYYKVQVPAVFRLQLNEPNYPRPALLNSCAEISPQICQTAQQSERKTQNTSGG